MIFLFVLHAAALLPKHRTKDRDTLIEQSFIKSLIPVYGFLPSHYLGLNFC